MKKLGKINLQNLGQAEMTKKELNTIKGGLCACHCVCSLTCGCKYAGGQTDPNDSYYGGSSQAVSGQATANNLVHNDKDSTTSSNSGNI